MLDADAPLADAKLIAPRIPGVEYFVQACKARPVGCGLADSAAPSSDVQGFFYIVTNAGGANNFKLMRTPIDSPDPTNWSMHSTALALLALAGHIT